jgi:hypothetical protein
MKRIRQWFHFKTRHESLRFTSHGPPNHADLATRLDSLAYINRLPIETLTDIFLHCLSFAPTYPLVIPKAGYAPLLLCQICAYWRQVALATPELWASIQIGPGTVHRLLASLWLERSQRWPLTFYISSLRPVKNYTKDILPMLLVNIDRWHCAYFGLDKSLCKLVLAVPRVLFPLSTATSLVFDAVDCTNEQRAQLLSIPRLFPMLRQLYFFAPFDHTSEFVPLPTTDLPCSRLTSIRLVCGLSLYQCSQILYACQQAERCELLGIHTSPQPINQQNIILPKLEILALESVPNSCDLGQLLGLLSCPAVRTLKVDQGKWRLSDSGMGPLKQFLTHLKHGLHELRLTNLNVPETELLECLRMPALKSIHTLYLSNQSFTDHILDFLQRKRETNYDPFPCLMDLSLEPCFSSDGTFANMVASRRNPEPTDSLGRMRGAVLESVYVRFGRPLTVEQLALQSRCDRNDDVRRAHKHDIAYLHNLEEEEEEGFHGCWSTNVGP